MLAEASRTVSLMRFMACSVCCTTSRPVMAVATASLAARDALAACSATFIVAAFISVNDEAKRSTSPCSARVDSEISRLVDSISAPAVATCAEAFATFFNAPAMAVRVSLIALIATANSSLLAAFALACDRSLCAIASSCSTEISTLREIERISVTAIELNTTMANSSPMPSKIDSRVCRDALSFSYCARCSAAVVLISLNCASISVCRRSSSPLVNSWRAASKPPLLRAVFS